MIKNLKYCIKRIIPDWILKRLLWLKVRWIILKQPANAINNLEYRILENKILNKYRQIEISFFDVSRVANMFFFLINMEENTGFVEGRLNIFIPVFFSGRENRILYFAEQQAANRVMLSKISEKAYVLNNKNLAFWKKFIKRHPFKVFISDRYSAANIIMYQQNQIKNKYDFHKIYIEFSSKEIMQGERFLQSVDLGNEYICFFARSEKYLQVRGISNGKELSCLNRDYSLSNFCLMGKKIFEQGIKSVRMGSFVDGKIEGEWVLDYANLYRTDFLDFYIVSKCKFLVCGLNGFIIFAHCFNKPLVLINAELLSYSGDFGSYIDCKRDIIIPKKRWDRKNKRYLTFGEIFQIEKDLDDKYLIAQYYHDNEIDYIENSQEEIYDAVQEMIEKLNGVVQYTDEDIKLQNKYVSIFNKMVKDRECFCNDARMGREFLRKNKWMLDE